MLVGVTGCVAYLEDFLVSSDTWESHFQCLNAVFGQLAEANLAVSLAKCEFAKATVNSWQGCRPG